MEPPVSVKRSGPVPPPLPSPSVPPLPAPPAAAVGPARSLPAARQQQQQQPQDDEGGQAPRRRHGGHRGAGGRRPGYKRLRGEEGMGRTHRHPPGRGGEGEAWPLPASITRPGSPPSPPQSDSQCVLTAVNGVDTIKANAE